MSACGAHCMLRPSGPSFDLRAAMSQELRDAFTALAAANDDSAALHRCRVHVKRARALARVGHACAPGLSSVFNDTARTLMRQLAHARDLAALGEAARAATRKSGGKRRAALRAVAEQLETERLAAPPVDVGSARTALKDLLALAMVWPEASPRQIKRGAKRVVRRDRAAYAKGRSSKRPQRRHQWRKRAKDRYFAAELMRHAWPMARRRKLSERLGDALGKERDVLLLMDRLQDAAGRDGESKTSSRAIKALKVRRKRLSKRADKLGERLYATL